jgi:hypothetical protein
MKFYLEEFYYLYSYNHDWLELNMSNGRYMRSCTLLCVHLCVTS